MKTYRPKRPRFYVEAITDRSGVIGYGVYDCIGGMVSRHHEFMIYPNDGPDGARIALHLANMTRDDLNAEVA